MSATFHDAGTGAFYWWDGERWRRARLEDAPKEILRVNSSGQISVTGQFSAIFLDEKDG